MSEPDKESAARGASKGENASGQKCKIWSAIRFRMSALNTKSNVDFHQISMANMFRQRERIGTKVTSQLLVVFEKLNISSYGRGLGAVSMLKVHRSTHLAVARAS